MINLAVKDRGAEDALGRLEGLCERFGLDKIYDPNLKDGGILLNRDIHVVIYGNYISEDNIQLLNSIMLD